MCFRIVNPNSTHRAKILEKSKNKKSKNKQKGKTNPHSGEQVYLGQDSKKHKTRLKSRLKPRLKSRLKKTDWLKSRLKFSVAESGFALFLSSTFCHREIPCGSFFWFLYISMRIICLVWCWFQVLEIQFEFGVESPAAFWGARLGWAGTCVFHQQKTNPDSNPDSKKQTDSNPDSNPDPNPDSNPDWLKSRLKFSVAESGFVFFLRSTFCYLSLQLSVFLCLVLSSGFGLSLGLFFVFVFILSIFCVLNCSSRTSSACVCVC